MFGPTVADRSRRATTGGPSGNKGHVGAKGALTGPLFTQRISRPSPTLLGAATEQGPTQAGDGCYTKAVETA